MRPSAARVRDLPHYRLPSTELANWLDAQDGDSWWSVDGDPLLMGRLDFPCPAADLSKLLRSIDRGLLLLDVRAVPLAHGETITTEIVDEVANADHTDDERVLQFCWEDDTETDWLLCEDWDSGRLADSGSAERP